MKKYNVPVYPFSSTFYMSIPVYYCHIDTVLDKSIEIFFVKGYSSVLEYRFYRS